MCWLVWILFEEGSSTGKGQSGTLSPGQIIKWREFNIGKYFQNSYRSEKTNREKEDSPEMSKAESGDIPRAGGDEGAGGPPKPLSGNQDHSSSWWDGVWWAGSRGSCCLAGVKPFGVTIVGDVAMVEDVAWSRERDARIPGFSPLPPFKCQATCSHWLNRTKLIWQTNIYFVGISTWVRAEGKVEGDKNGSDWHRVEESRSPKDKGPQCFWERYFLYPVRVWLANTVILWRDSLNLSCLICMSASLLWHVGNITKINYQYGTCIEGFRNGGGVVYLKHVWQERIENTLFDILTSEIQVSYPLSTMPKSISL